VRIDENTFIFVCMACALLGVIVGFVFATLRFKREINKVVKAKFYAER
jgi:ABC-type uncharacterized transport system permease subunit